MDLLNPEPVPPELKERLQHPPPQDQRESIGVQQAPGDLQPLPSSEVRTGKLMSERLGR